MGPKKVRYRLDSMAKIFRKYPFSQICFEIARWTLINKKTQFNLDLVTLYLLFSDKSRFSDSFAEDQKFNATIKNSLSDPTLHNLLRTRKKDISL